MIVTADTLCVDLLSQAQHRRSMASQASQKLDLVLFGATGFTGQQTLMHLARWVPRGFKWAIAGRNREKLEALLPLCEGASAKPVIRVADSTDAVSVNTLAAATRVVIQLAGPYGKTGEAFIAAAAQHGTHYLDLTGEIGWVTQMITNHQAAAHQSKAKIVPVCGFEALPFDMGALLIAEKLRSTTGEKAVSIALINQFTGPLALRPRDVLSGGTMASIKAMLEDGAGASLSDPATLVTDETLAARIRDVGRYDFRAKYSDDVSAWLAPTVPAPFVNPPVVYRSMSLLAGSKASPFAAECRYDEALSTRGMVPFALGQRLLAETLSRSFTAMAKSVDRNGTIDQIGRAAVKQFMEWFGPSPGQGPSDKHLEQSGYTMHLRATSSSGATVVGSATAQGHPGYRSTAMLIAEAGLLLAGAGADGCAALPRRSGFLTPATAFGAGSTPAWARAGLVFE
jgi:short subunit dehydrogenase-like uncharacterized protein